MWCKHCDYNTLPVTSEQCEDCKNHIIVEDNVPFYSEPLLNDGNTWVQPKPMAE